MAGRAFISKFVKGLSSEQGASADSGSPGNQVIKCGKRRWQYFIDNKAYMN